MDGLQFYEYLRENYNQNGKKLYGNFKFHDWLFKPKTNSYSFRFKLKNNPPKSIPKEVIIGAWEANEIIDDEWLTSNFDIVFHCDCRTNILNYLIKTYKLKK